MYALHNDKFCEFKFRDVFVYVILYYFLIVIERLLLIYHSFFYLSCN